MIRRLAAAGARGDVETRRVTFPPGLVEERLALAPNTLALAGRDPACELHLDGTCGYLSVDGNVAEILDLGTGERRASTKEDLAQISRVADALPQIGFWQGVAARDMPLAVQPLHELHAQYANSTKHVQLMTAALPEQARGAVEIAAIVAGGEAGPRAPRAVLVPDEPVAAHVRRPPARGRGDLRAGRRPGGVRRDADQLCDRTGDARRGPRSVERRDPRWDRGARTPRAGRADLLRRLRHGDGPVDRRRVLRRTRGSPVPDGRRAARAAIRAASNIGTFASGAKSPDWQAGVENGLSIVASGSAAPTCSRRGPPVRRACVLIAELLLDAEIFARAIDGRGRGGHG